MSAILTAVIPVVIIGIICAAVLVTASKLMAVKEDERLPLVRECLPGANCGACGYAGCDGYAKALVEEGVEANLCIPGGAAAANAIAEVLGVEVGDVAAKVAVIHCAGDCNNTEDIVDYMGIESCSAAKLIFGGKGSCGYGCLGLGDCMRACPEEAICLENGIAHINTKLCIGCGICTKTCPNNLISLVKDEAHVIVTCSNKDKGAVTRKVCKNGCIGCRKCVKVCPADAISVNENLASIDYEKCVGCGACARECTTGCIMLDDGVRLQRVK